jgi:predicted AAA+ superfamily ATPase
MLCFCEAMIPRTIQNQLKEKLFKGKATLLMGPRQVGKTTLLQEIVKPYQNKKIWLSGDDISDRERFINVRFSATFLNAYPVTETKVIHTKNYDQWLL